MEVTKYITRKEKLKREGKKKNQKKKKKTHSQYDAKKESFLHAKSLVAQLAPPSISNY